MSKKEKDEKLTKDNWPDIYSLRELDAEYKTPHDKFLAEYCNKPFEETEEQRFFREEIGRPVPSNPQAKAMMIARYYKEKFGI